MCIVFTQDRRPQIDHYHNHYNDYGENKTIRHFVYIVCSVCILIGMLFTGFKLFSVFWGEVFMLIAFGIAYLVQGKIILKDK